MAAKSKATTTEPDPLVAVEDNGRELRAALADRGALLDARQAARHSVQFIGQQLELQQKQAQNAMQARDAEEQLVASHQAILEEKQLVFQQATNDLRQVEKQFRDAQMQLTAVETRLNSARRDVNVARTELLGAIDAAAEDEAGEHPVLSNA